MDNRDKIIDFVKAKGPVLPVQISKLIGTDIVMASAHLAELTATNKMKISTIKVGGSPLYYLSGQEAMLQKYTAGMNDKEKKAYDLLDKKKILRDSEQEPVIRVALRELKDFAKPLNVKYGGNSEIFWKWYLVSDEEAGKIIKSKLDIIEKEVKEETKIQPEIKKEVQQKQPEIVQKQREFPVEKNTEEKPIEKVQQQLKEAIEKPIEKRGRKPKEASKEDEFMKNIMKFFEKNKIIIISTEIIKKNSEFDFIIEIPSVMGNLQYYCKAKNKKRISDSDLSNAYVKGQFKKLPVIVLSPGELSTKAEEMMKKELNNLTFKQV